MKKMTNKEDIDMNDDRYVTNFENINTVNQCVKNNDQYIDLDSNNSFNTINEVECFQIENIKNV